MIQEIDGNTDRGFINNFVKNNLLARDSKALREYVRTISPDYEFKVMNSPQILPVKRRHLIYLSGLGFFTLPSDYSIQLHSQIWEMVNYGNGFTWKEVYTMPIHWRRFYFNKLVEAKKERKRRIR
jgi:hypothetical protein